MKRRHQYGGPARTILALAVAAAMLAAVGGTAQGGPAGAAKKRLPRKTVGIMGPVDSAEIIKLANDATEAAAKSLGWRTMRVDPQGDPAKMASGMTSLVNAGVDAIVLTTMEPATIQSGLRAARRRHIPVIDTHTKTRSSPLFAGEYFLPPAREFNLLYARMKRSLRRGSEIGTINLPQFLNAKIAGDLVKPAARRAGWTIRASHDADLANLVPDTQRAVGDMIRANPGLDAVWGCCDFVPTGAVPAIRASRKNIKVYSLHGIPSTMPQARTGLAVVEVADYQLGGVVAIDVLARHFAFGTKIPKQMPKRFRWHMKIVSRANAGKGYPYPTRKVLAPFKRRWARLYTRAG
jgi:ABC-type sugar transport system substrate-binding protein